VARSWEPSSTYTKNVRFTATQPFSIVNTLSASQWYIVSRLCEI